MLRLTNMQKSLTIEHVQAAIGALAANEVPTDAVKCIEILSCGHTVCISMDQPPYIIDGDNMEMIKPCCQQALNAKWSKYFA